MSNNDEHKNNGFNKFIRYSSLAFEMGIIIAAGAFAGLKIDGHFDNETPWATVGLSLFAVFASTYLVIKSLKDGE
ncbi:MAG: AtpZ/AtpI family protein [Bacteroidales bacterium]|nr:AtpZ/AtpI family protein [Bacteroidales bacterium]